MRCGGVSSRCRQDFQGSTGCKILIDWILRCAQDFFEWILMNSLSCWCDMYFIKYLSVTVWIYLGPAQNTCACPTGPVQKSKWVTKRASRRQFGHLQHHKQHGRPCCPIFGYQWSILSKFASFSCTRLFWQNCRPPLIFADTST